MYIENGPCQTIYLRLKEGIRVIVRKVINSCWFFTLLAAGAAAIVFQRYYPWWATRTEAFRGAVLGTFSGIAVGIVVFLASKYYESRVKRYNALCNMELILNNLLASLSDNQHQIKKALATDEITLVFQTPLVLTEQDLREIGRADLKNKLLGVLIDCRKYNESVTHALKIFETNIETFKAFEANQFARRSDIIRGILRDFYRQLKIKLKEIYEFGTVIEKGIEDAVVDTRFFVKRDRLLPITLNPYYDSKDLERWRTTDMDRLRKECARTAADDEKRRKQREAETTA